MTLTIPDVDPLRNRGVWASWYDALENCLIRAGLCPDAQQQTAAARPPVQQQQRAERAGAAGLSTARRAVGMTSPAALPPKATVSVRERVLAYIENTPGTATGEGGCHAATFRLAVTLAHGFALAEGDVMAMLRLWNQKCDPPWADHELLHKARGACQTAPANGKPRGWLLDGAEAPAPMAAPVAKPRKEWPDFDAEKAASIVFDAGHGGEAELWESSPVHVEDDRASIARVHEALFPHPHELLVMRGPAWDDVVNLPRHRYRGRECRAQHMMPNYADAREGLTKLGRLSCCCSSLFTRRRFLVVEFDIKKTKDPLYALMPRMKAAGISERDACANLLMHLSEFAPLACVVWSGSLSLHGWFYADGASDAQVTPFAKMAVELGGDKGVMQLYHGCRVPGGTRYDDAGRPVARQKIIYYSPDILS